jgi:Rod binding domain-containing protein
MNILPLSTAHPTATPQMRQVAQAFEGQVLSMLLKPIFASASNARSVFGGGAAEEQWQPFMTEAYATRMAQAGGLGIRDMVLSHMIRIQEAQQHNQETQP